MDLSSEFWNSSVDELKRGYVKRGEKFICLICGECFEEGVVYKDEDVFCQAEKFMKRHVQKNHGSMFEYLVKMNKKFTGVSDVQRDVLLMFGLGLEDKEIAKQTRTSDSTVRNHRFKLKEKEKQAKIFLAIMELLKDADYKENSQHALVDMHKTATMVDDRYNVTEEEAEKIIKNYFDENNKLLNFPAKEKRKIVVLKHITTNFKIGIKYTEKEINRILERVNEDYVSLRRDLIEYGFLDRTKDCKHYWVKE